ncbi:antibiotic biosynthesis monooxygenase [Lysobacter xanthus]
MNPTPPVADPGATAVISHRVLPSKLGAYEAWLDEIAPLCRAAPGHLDWHIVRPIPGLTETYTIVIRFDSVTHLEAWMRSTERSRLIAQLRPLLAGDDNVRISSGLDFWFAPAEPRAPVPVRWKQYLVTWSAIYPLALAVPHLVGGVLGSAGLSLGAVMTTLIVTGIVVFLMVYVVMPRYTRLVRRWLFA